MSEKRIVIFQRESGRQPFVEWLDRLGDRRARAVVRARLNRVALGNFGDCKSVGSNVLELRISYGPGYRIYFGRDGEDIVILLCGGDKSSQQRDIVAAKIYWKEYQSAYQRL